MATDQDPRAALLGARIRRLRHARGLTLVQVADACDLSHPFLSQLERGHARPSFASLEKIARALGTSQAELFADEDEPLADPVVLVRADEGSRGPFAEGEARMLVAGRRRFHAMEVRGANTAYGDAFVHDEDEWLHVVTGRVEVDLGPHGTHVLGPADSVYYAGGTPHRWRTLDAGEFRLVVVKEHPARS